MDNYYANQYSYFESSDAYGGNQSNQNAYGGGQSNPNAYGGGQSNPDAYGVGQGNPNAYEGQGNPNAYGGGQGNSNAYGGGQGNLSAYGGGQTSSNAFGGGQGNPNAYGGSQDNPNAYGGGQGNPNAYGGVQSNPNAFGGGQSNPNAYGGGPGNSNTYGGQGSSSAYGGGQANNGAYGGGQANSGAYGGQANSGAYGGQANPGTYGDGQANSGAYGGGQGNSSAYGGGQGNSTAYGGDRGNSSTYGGGQGNSNSYGGDQHSSIVDQGTNPQGDQIYASRNENDSRKIFVGGLSWDVTTDDLHQYFQQFGEVVDANLKINPATNQSRGFGFILFKDEAAVDRTVAHSEHILKGRTIDPKRAVAEGSRELNSKIFVGGIDPRMGKEEIMEAFSKFGMVKQIELPYDKVKNERRGFGFITFESEDIAELVCRNGKVGLGKRKVDVRRLNTKDNRPVPDAMGRPRIPTANVPPATQPHRFPHQGRGRGGPARGAFSDGYVDPNVYQNNGMYRSGCSEEDDEFSTLQTAYQAIAAMASTVNMPMWGECGGGGGGYRGGFDQPSFRGRGGYDRSKRGGPSPRGSAPGRGGGGPARGGAPGRGGTGGQTGAGFHPYNR